MVEAVVEVVVEVVAEVVAEVVVEVGVGNSAVDVVLVLVSVVLFSDDDDSKELDAIE